MCGIVLSKDPSDIKIIKHRGLECYTANTKSDYHCQHTRLPIQTVIGDAWTQPIIIKEDVIMMYNGEIFNYNELSIMQYENDVEFLIAMLLRYDADSIEFKMILNQLDGFWSIVIYDGRNDRIISIVDPLSKKQLYYTTTCEFAIASEIKPLLNHSRMQYDRMYKAQIYAYGYNVNNRTPWSDIKRQMPNTIMVFGFDGSIKNIIHDYYNWDSNCPNNLHEAIQQSVKRRLISKQYPIALLLSGGLDSTIILYHLDKLEADSIAIVSINNDEQYYANLAGNYFNRKVDYLEYDLSSIDFKDLYRNKMEMPIDLGSVVPQFKLFEHINERIVLSGDGADELFGGYARNQFYDSQLTDVFEELPFYHLPRLDRSSMFYTKELRSPFLGHDVIKIALSLAHEQRKFKKILKEIYKDVIPNEIINRQKYALKNPEIREDKIAYRYKVLKEFYSN